jgi:hypothetical protein
MAPLEGLEAAGQGPYHLNLSILAPSAIKMPANLLSCSSIEQKSNTGPQRLKAGCSRAGFCLSFLGVVAPPKVC